MRGNSSDEMSGLEEEKYLSNRAKVERVKVKVKIRFKEFARITKKKKKKKSYLAVILLVCQAILLKTPPASTTNLNQLDRLQTPLPAAGSSELSFEYLALDAVPSEQLCTLARQLHLSAKPTTNQVNLVSFANNRIGQINSSAFICMATKLKILNLRNNKIELISHDAFSGLNHLQVLLLDGNQLRALPIVALNQLAATLRHLDLSANLIGALESGAPPLQLPALISLSLKANPLDHIHRSALASLKQLQTLTLTQTRLQEAHLEPLEGLLELRYLHLDRLANVSSLEANFCQPSRKLASLSLKSNQLAQVPRLTNCQALLSLDLSHNKISSTLSGNFSLLANLIDLYLDSNQLETLTEQAFVGLARLQVLHLSWNRLKHIHTSAFVPLRATLYELNLAHNLELSQLTHLEGLEQLVSFKAHGNTQLKKLPHFPSAKLLTFTYAYHCCDYLTNTRRSSIASPRSRTRNHTGRTGNVSLELYDQKYLHEQWDDEDDESASLAGQLVQLVATKLARFLSWPSAGAHTGGERNDDLPAVTSDDRAERWPGQNVSVGSALDSAASSSSSQEADNNANFQNLSELVLWPNRKSLSDSSRWAPDANLGANLMIGARGSGRAKRQASGRREPRWGRQMGAGNKTSAAREQPKAGQRRAQHFSGIAPEARLIDELIWRLKQIRGAHSVRAFRQLGASFRNTGADDDDCPLTAWNVNELSANERQLVSTARWRGEQSAGDSMEARRVAVALARDFQQWSPADSSRAGLESGPLSRRARSEPANELDGDLERQSSAKRARATTETGVRCEPRPDAFQPCRDLFDSVWLRASIWLVFVFAFVGNILVIVVLGSVRPSSSASALTSIMWFNAAHSKRHIDVPRFLVLNLAVADLLMALYLGLLAFVDVSTLGEFRVYAIRWQHSTGCRLAGFLAVLSSELSVFILAIITLERNYAITNAVHLNRRLSLQKAMFIMLLGYLYAFTMAILPLNGINDYRRSSLCLPLHFQPHLSLWSSTANLYLLTLVGINSLSFLLLVGCYLRMYCAIRGSQAWNTNDLKIAKRMSILVVTDFLCWMPIIFVGSFALLHNYLVGPEGLKVLIIFVLPLNSVANPFLYAITTKKFKRDLKVLKKRLKLEQVCHLLGLLFSLLTTCRRPRRKTAHYAKATVAIRRNQQACKQQVPRAKANLNYDLNRQLASAKSKKTGQLEIVITDPQCRRIVASSRYKDTPNLAANKPGEAKPLNEFQTGSGSNSRKRHEQRHWMAPRKGSQLLAKTMRLMRGGDMLQGDSVNAEGAIDESRALNAANTYNPVTMNKTTCFSCQQRLAAANDSFCNSPSCPSQNDEHQQQQHQQQQQLQPIDHLKRPRIVLDSIELRPNEIYSDDEATTPREFLLQQQLHAKQVHSQLCGQSSWQSDSNNNQQGGGSPISMTFGQMAPQVGAAQLRPSSAGSGATCESGDRIERRKTAHVSCQTILVNERQSRTRIGTMQQIDLNQDGRSVSACAFNWPTRSANNDRSNHLINNHFSHQLAPNIDPSAQVCSCSCDAIGAQFAQKATSKEKKRPVTASSSSQSRSINKLMFGTFAKAWSTLQLSLQSQWGTNATQTIAELPTQRHKESVRMESVCPDGQVVASNQQHYSSDENTSESGSDSMDHNDIIDDILQMSSPSRRRLLNERRMSRSCDLIIGHAPNQDANSTSGATTEPNSSSYDHNDDQRILLATINQLTTRRKKRRHVVGPKQRAKQVMNSPRKRASCTRCRSWSPALLDKLEDCMYQIKSRLPKLGSKDQTCVKDEECDYRAIGHQSSRQSSTTTTGLSIFKPANEPHTQKSTPGALIDVEAAQLNSSSEELQLAGNSADDLEVDDFHEIGFVEWTRNMQKKAPINCYSGKRKMGRLHQQLSGNSDTLSSRTFGTTLTNLSFDSSSSIPAALACVEQKAVQDCPTGTCERSDSTE